MIIDLRGIKAVFSPNLIQKLYCCNATKWLKYITARSSWPFKLSWTMTHCIAWADNISDSIIYLCNDNHTVPYSRHNSIRLRACCTVHTEGQQMAMRAVDSGLTGDWLVPVCEHLVSHWFTHGLTPPYSILSCTDPSLHCHPLTCLILASGRVSSQNIYPKE